MLATAVAAAALAAPFGAHPPVHHHHHTHGCRSHSCDVRTGRRWYRTHRPKCRWITTGATLDPTQGQAPTYSAHGGYSFAELLEAGSNAGLRPDLTSLLGRSRGGYGMPMGASIMLRSGPRGRRIRIYKNDVGSGQGGDSHFTIDLHQAAADAIGFSGYGDVQVSRC